MDIFQVVTSCINAQYVSLLHGNIGSIRFALDLLDLMIRNLMFFYVMVEDFYLFRYFSLEVKSFGYFLLNHGFDSNLCK